MKAWITRFPVLTLAVIVLGIQFGIVLVTSSMIPEGMRLHDVPDAHMVFRFRVFWPLVFAVLITYYIEGWPGLRNLFGAYKVWKVPGKWYAYALSWKFLFCYLAWAVADIMGWLPWPGASIPMFTEGENGERMHIFNLIATMPFIVGIAMVEETTWMKFCATRMQEKYSAFTSCFVTGIIWGLWYLPMLLLGEGVPDGIPWYTFLLSMAGLAIVLGWVYNMTHSGLLLLLMQLISNIAFFIVPALPVCHNGDSSYVKAFVYVELVIAAFLILRYGWRDMGVAPRPKWSDGMPSRSEPANTSVGEAQASLSTS